MSVMLTATRKALRKKSPRPKSSKPAGSSKSVGGAGAMSSAPRTTVSSANVKQWLWDSEVPSEPLVNVIFRKDTMDIWVDSVKVEPMSSFQENGSAMDFAIKSNKARIAGKKEPDSGEMVYTLTVNGQVIPLFTK